MTDNEESDGGGDSSITDQQLDGFDTNREDSSASEISSATKEIQRSEPNDPANDPLFVREGDEDGSSTPIWADRDLLSIGTVPGPDRIVGRDTEIKSVAGEIRHLVHESQPNHVVIYGETGTGKSLVSRHVSDRLVDTATARNVPAASIYVECKKNNTETRVARTIARALSDKSGSGIEIPRVGLGSAEYYDYAYDIIDEYYDGLIVILDEIDMVDDAEGLLHELSRAREAGHTDAYIGIIAISNDIDFGQKLNARVQSSMRTTDFVFEPYQSDQIEQILEYRRDAFQDGVVQDGVITETADRSADEHGDARKAVDVLRIAGDIADDNDAEVVSADHVDKAVKRAEINRVKETIESTSPQSKLVLYTLGRLTGSNNRRFRTSGIYSQYETTCGDVGADPLSYDRVSQILSTLALMGISESHQIGGGHKQGVYLEHQLIKDKDVVMKAVVESDERLSELHNGTYEI
ncbi:Cdc6/Cdc18 family protein [Halovenus rubra]|jgi:cell division control protein 6|uniref:ORC1-type DNA replication protein n=3 Tax=Haloarculaceae TaxID=1963268 RepID=F7PGV7_9EURY|nr:MULTISPECIES: AAA family ATPase [Haloarculaceae]ERJ06558.1 cell division control protein 6 [Halorhabdus tiamatea SARL4B]CCQ35064.1 orc1/cdc6 family replication initiation protein [Halorhabdus tiamatea SARL4B]